MTENHGVGGSIPSLGTIFRLAGFSSAFSPFGPRVRAWAVTAGGESGDPASRHFNDQAARYATGDLRPVYFHPDELASHIARTYRPGE